MQPENPPSEITSTSGTETTARNQESKSQNWKKHFIEFLMIFLAVTLGFFAESYREHLIDRSEEREYLVQLVDDLREDIAECGRDSSNSVIAINTRIGNYCSTMSDILSKKNPSKKEVVTAYYMYQWVASDWFTAYFKDATWSQLKSNGGVKNIDNSHVVREINDYYKWAHVINDYKDEIRKRHSAITYNDGRKVFDQRMGKRMLDAIDSKFYAKLFDTVDPAIEFVNDPLNDLVDVQFAPHSSETTLGLCNDLRSYKSLLTLYAGMLTTQRIKAEKLVHLITEEYGLQD